MLLIAGCLFQSFSLWQLGRMAANKTLPYFDRGRVAVWPQKQNIENIVDLSLGGTLLKNSIKKYFFRI